MEMGDISAKIKLYQQQVELLDTFIKTGAITKAQYNKSFTDLTAKMFPQGLPETLKNKNT